MTRLINDDVRFNMIFDDGQSLVHLLDASQDYSLLMNRTHQCAMYPGSKVVIEVLPSGCLLASTKDDSAAMQALLKQKSSVVLFFNNPFQVKTGAGTEGGDLSEFNADIDVIDFSNIFEHPTYDLSIEALLDQPLQEIMSLIAVQVGDGRLFHCKRSSTSPQLKDTEKTLRELAFVNHSIIHLQVTYCAAQRRYLC